MAATSDLVSSLNEGSISFISQPFSKNNSSPSNEVSTYALEKY